MLRTNPLRSGLATGLILGALLLTGCEVDLSDKEETNSRAASVRFTLNGEAHGYLAAPEANAVVWISDAAGKTIETTTNAYGAFSADITALQSPLLVAVKGAEGVWYSYIANASRDTFVMVNPLTSSLLTHEILSRYGVLDGVTDENDGPAITAARATAAPATRQSMAQAAAAAEKTAEEKFQELVAAGIFDSFDDGNQGLSEKINRAQFSQLIGLILGLERQESPASSFSDVSFGLGTSFDFFAQAAQAGLVDIQDSPFTPSSISRDQLLAILGTMTGAVLELSFDPAGNGSGNWAMNFLDSLLPLELLDDSELGDLLASEDFRTFARNLTGGINGFKLADPSFWSYSISGSISGRFNDSLNDSGCLVVDSSRDAALNFSEDLATGCLIVGAGATLPVNEAELAQWLRDTVRRKVEYYGGSFRFDELELSTTGIGVVGSTLQAQASGSVKLGPKEESADFVISNLTLTRTEAPTLVF